MLRQELVFLKQCSDPQMESNITMGCDNLYFCKVCGYKNAEAPWGEDGQTPSFEMCPCCGVEFGFEDYLETGLRDYREKWIQEGCPWFKERMKPPHWSLEDQLGNLK